MRGLQLLSLHLDRLVMKDVPVHKFRPCEDETAELDTAHDIHAIRARGGEGVDLGQDQRLTPGKDSRNTPHKLALKDAPVLKFVRRVQNSSTPDASGVGCVTGCAWIALQFNLQLRSSQRLQIWTRH